jgi:hypothetical protein
MKKDEHQQEEEIYLTKNQLCKNDHLNLNSDGNDLATYLIDRILDLQDAE